MFKYFKNESGIALIMVIVLLVLVGGLTAALLTAGIFNIGFGSDEVDRAQAFYAADAGVEYTQNAIYRLSPEQINDLMNNEGKYIEFYQNDEDISFAVYEENDNNSWVNLSNDAKFRIKLSDEGSEEVSFISIGEVYSGLSDRTMNQRIEFSFDKSFIYDVALLLKSIYGSRWFPDREYSLGDIVLHGGIYYEAKNGHINGHISDELNEPGEGDDWEDFWEEIIDPDEDKSDYIDMSGEASDFSEDSVELVGTDSWREFLDPEYVKFSDETNEVIDYQGFTSESISHISSGNITEDTFFTQTVEMGDITIWDEGLDYWEDDVVLNKDNDKYYVAIEDHHSVEDNKPGEGDNWEDFWIVADEDYQFNSVNIENSIVIVDGSLRMTGNINLVNSLLLVKEEITFGGNTSLDKSLIYAFNSNDKETDVANTLGNPSIDVLDLVTSDQYDDWPGIKEALNTIGNDMIENLHIVRWRQL